MPQAHALPVKRLVDRRGYDPRLSACKADVLATITNSPYLVPNVGLEPTKPSF